jgi:hypothetical protein
VRVRVRVRVRVSVMVRVRVRVRVRVGVGVRDRVRVQANLRRRVAEQQRVTAPAAVAEGCGCAPLHAQKGGAVAVELVLCGGGLLCTRACGGLGRRRLDVKAADVHPRRTQQRRPEARA